MTHRVSALAASLVLVTTASAWAGGITTPPLSVGTGSTLNCRVLNTGLVIARDVTIEIRNGAGVVTETNTLDIAGGETQAVDENAPQGIAYCRVTGIARGKALVTLCLVDAGGNCTTAVTAP